jgi:hypothetical protein
VKQVNEAFRPIDKITWLVRNGLGSDITRLPYYTQAIQNPQGTVSQVAFRGYVAEVLDNLLDIVFKDPVVYARVASQLLSNNKPANLNSIAFESLIKKAEKSGVAVDTIIEIYNKGYNDQNRPKHLTAEQYGFNRVNSYLAKGGAYKVENPLNNTMAEQSISLKVIKKMVKHG